MQSDEVEIGLLKMQYELQSKEIHGLSQILHHSIGFIVPILVTAAGYAYAQGILLLLVILPFVMAGAILYAMQAMAAIETIAGHKEWIEGRLNELTGRNTLFWEDLAGHAIVMQRPQQLNLVAMAAFFLSAAVAGVYSAYQSWGRPIAIWIALGLLALTVTIVFSLLAVRRCRRVAIAWSHKAAAPSRQ